MPLSSLVQKYAGTPGMTAIWHEGSSCRVSLVETRSGNPHQANTNVAPKESW